MTERGCTVCEAIFEPQRMGQRVCSPRCAVKVPKLARKAARATLAKRKAAVQTRGQLIAKAQAAFNAYIRARDAGKPCICCGEPFSPDKPGGSVDAGHYLSRGSAPHLRFNEDNCFAQRKGCNRPGGTTRMQFRAGVIARIGLAAVEALEANQEPRKWTLDELRTTATYYRALARRTMP